MTRADAPAFSTLLAGLAETFDVTLTATRTELYFRALEDLPLEAVQEAAGKALRQSRFFPKPAELRDFVTETHQEAGELAWLRLLDAFQDGYYETVLPEDPITQALVRVYWGGAGKARDWWRLCHDAALEARHREFVARYQTYAERPHDLPRLPGGRSVFALLEEAQRRALTAGSDRDDG
jgi:hypothetical protein